MPISFVFGTWLCTQLIVQPAASQGRLKPQEHLANLQRTAAACDDTIDVYRLGMLEAAQAMELVVAAGQDANTTSASPIPKHAQQTFARLAQTISHRVDKDALNALFRAYHFEIVDALERLGRATELGQVLDPAQALVHALEQQIDLSAHLIDIYARQRPWVDNIVSPDDAFNQINDALDQLSLAEQNIDNVKRTHGSSGQLFQAFLRLEITLGHALDLIAAADNVGMEMGIEPAANTHGFSDHLDYLRTHARALHACFDRMRQPPIAPTFNLQAIWRQSDDPKKPSYADMTWTPPVPDARDAARDLRLFRKLDVETARNILLERQACQAPLSLGPDANVDATLAALIGADPNAPQTLALLPPGRGGYQDTQLALPALPWLYRVASVSAFGVEHPGTWQKLEYIPVQLQPPYGVQATPVQIEPNSELFYHDAGSVRITWQASESDLVHAAALKARARAEKKPIVARYAVFRIDADARVFLGATQQGVTQWIDRPPLASLAKGVHYAVAAVDAEGHQARASGHCAQSNLAELDLHDDWQLFAAGAMYHEASGLWQTQRLSAMQDAQTRNAERQAFLHTDSATQAQAWARFWQQTPTAERIRWHHHWLELMDAGQRARFVQQPHTELPRAMQPWYQAALWCQQHPAWADEPRRYFDLLTPEAKEHARKRWQEVIGFAHAQRFEKAWQQADAKTRTSLALPMQQMAWFKSRDPQEQDQARQAFASLSPLEQQAVQKAFWASLPDWLQEAASWPDWETLLPNEREAFLRAAPGALDPDLWPNGLWPAFLVNVAWEHLPTAQKAQIIRQEVGVYRAWLSQFKTLLHPWDVRFDFKLITGFWLVVFGLTLGFLLQKLRQYVDEHDAP